MPMNDLRDVLVETVRDLYSAEAQALKALPRLAKAATHPPLKEAFTAHLEETRGQVERLDRVVELLGAKAKGKKCVAMEGLVAEAQEIIAEKGGDPTAKDAALICAAQKQEHYEIAAYGSARTFAAVLGEDEVAKLLEQTLAEEKAADEKLTAAAESGLNQQAAEGDDGELDDEEDAPKPAAKKKPAAAKAKR
jgi:ferritin-like metal-binding protein YciE